MMRWTAAGLLLLGAGGVGAVWAWGWSGRAVDFTMGQAAFHVAVGRGVIAVTEFSMVAEEDGYRTCRAPCWGLEAVLLGGAMLVSWGMIKPGRGGGGRGFPVG